MNLISKKTAAKYMFRGMLLVALTGISITTNMAASRYQPGDNSYWVVETNANTKNFSIVKFYNQANELVYEEKIEGVYLDIRRKKSKKMLNHILQMVTENTLVATRIKGSSGLVAEGLIKKEE